jgi:serine phosphatase RsbU (regulator of sigma subunit)
MINLRNRVNPATARVLVVDDNADNRDVLMRRLRRLGLADIVQAADGLEALERLRSGDPFDLVLLDMMMPHMSGIEVLEAMKAEGRLEQTPVVMISAASEVDTVVRCIELGAEDYLSKPFDPALLAARVRSVLEKKFLRAENKSQLERLEQELAEAWLHQQSMLPTEFPVDPATVEIHALIEPALEVGGDLYDVFEIRPGLICIAIGDVAGKGTAAALFMARTRSLLRAGTLQFQEISGRTPRPSKIAALVNDELCKNNPHSKFVTLFIGFLDIESGELTFCNAGHIYPILAGSHGVREVDAVPDSALGVFEGLAFSDQMLMLAVGEALILTSDGLSDMLNNSMESYGAERARAAIAEMNGMPVAEIINRSVAAARAFAGDAPQFDDITMLGVRRLR